MPSDKKLLKVICLLKDFIYLCKASRKSRQASLSWVITLKLVAFFCIYRYGVFLLHR